MNEIRSDPEVAAALLLELLRTLRARQFYDRDHPATRRALRRAARVFGEGLRAGPLELELRGGELRIRGGPPVREPALAELGALLARQDAQVLRFAPGVSQGELAALVEGLAAPAPAALAELLEREGARHISVSGSAGEPEPPEAAPREPARTPAPQASPDEEEEETPTRVEPTVALLRSLSDLERCEDLESYRRLSISIAAAAEVRLAEKNPIDVYRAALCYARHASDPGKRLPEIVHEARERLARLLADEDLFEYVVGRAAAATDLSSVQAAQVLECAGRMIVPFLLRRYLTADGPAQAPLASILIAMADEAVADVAEATRDERPEWARRAVRLLGDLQNPAAVDYLEALLGDADPALAREAARSLGRVGTDRALGALANALRGPRELGLLAVGCLGSARSPIALGALCHAIRAESEVDDEVRREAIRSLGRIRDIEALGALGEVLAHGSILRRRRVRALRVAAAHAIARIRGDRATRLLLASARDPDPAVRDACRAGLQALSGPGVEP